MALFTDSDIVTLDDLKAIDSDVVRVAESSKNPSMCDAAIRGAWEECAHTITSKVQSYGGAWAGFGLGSGHLAAVFNTGGGGSYSAPRVRLSEIVASYSQYPGARSLIERWMQYTAAYLFFRDAANRGTVKDGDRLSAKMDLYNAERKTAWGRLESTGLPCAIAPLSCPGALHEPNTGTWDETNVTVTGTATGPAIPYEFAVTWVGSQYPQINTESAGSASAIASAGVGQAATVSIATLAPATGNYQTQGIADGVTPGMAAVGWNLYVGMQGTSLVLQNSTPMALTTLTAQITSFRTTGPRLGQGQSAFRNLAFVRTVGRA